MSILSWALPQYSLRAAKVILSPNPDWQPVCNLSAHLNKTIKVHIPTHLLLLLLVIPSNRNLKSIQFQNSFLQKFK